MKLKSLLLATLLGLILSACSYISPYKIEIQQGNVLTQEAVAQLKPGMTRTQVRYLLGTPLLTDTFHADRWDYVYSLRQKGKLTEERHIALYFSGDSLVRVAGDVVAASASAPAASAVAAEVPTATPASGVEVKGLQP